MLGDQEREVQRAVQQIWWLVPWGKLFYFPGFLEFVKFTDGQESRIRAFLQRTNSCDIF